MSISSENLLVPLMVCFNIVVGIDVINCFHTHYDKFVNRNYV